MLTGLAVIEHDIACIEAGAPGYERSDANALADALTDELAKGADPARCRAARARLEKLGVAPRHTNRAPARPRAPVQVQGASLSGTDARTAEIEAKLDRFDAERARNTSPAPRAAGMGPRTVPRAAPALSDAPVIRHGVMLANKNETLDEYRARKAALVATEKKPIATLTDDEAQSVALWRKHGMTDAGIDRALTQLRARTARR